MAIVSAERQHSRRPAAGEPQQRAGSAAGSFSRRQLLRSAAAAGTAAVGALTLPPAADAASELRSVAAWESMFLRIWDRDHASLYLPRSISADSRTYYDLAYGLDAAAAMFQATGKPAYLDRGLLYVENIIASAQPSSSFPRSRFKDAYSGWICREAGSYDGQEVVLYEIYFWRYVTRLLRLMQANPGVWGDAGYFQRFQNILAFTERNIFDKWYARGPKWYIYREVTHITAHFGYIALDVALMTADATRRSRCLAVFDNINHALPNRPGCSLRAQLIAHPTVSGGLFWNPSWGSFSLPGSDTAHGNGVVSFIVEAQELGMEWTLTDINGLIATLNAAILLGGSTTASYIDGSGRDGWINDGWVKLGRYSIALQQRLEAYKRAQNCQLWGNCALNAKLLGA